AARTAIRAAGAHRLFLPPYSPDLNPIEHLTRQGEPGTVEATWRRVGHVLDLAAPDACANSPGNSGYAAV
ncbi:transposase, partial [Methylobacterium crusticola]